MGFDFEERKALCFADLFKLPNPNNGEENQSMATQRCDEWSASSFGRSSTFDSSSSGLSSPFGSELGSSESEDGDFIAELSRQMAECMLQEDDDSVADSAPSHSISDLDRNRKSYIELRNQHPVRKQVSVSRVKGGELTQQIQFQKTEQGYGRYRERNWRNAQVGSGMRAVFLGGSGSRKGPSGTGVFLPRLANNDKPEQKKKSGLSTVLIPTRVLEALDHHFNRLSDSEPSTRGSSPTDKWRMPNRQGGNRQHSKFQLVGDMNKVEADTQLLPQEWTY